MGKLSTDEVTSELSNLTGWIFLNDCIEKEYTFDSYLDGIAFVNEIAEKAEEQNHHPDLEVGWCRVKVAFTSHDTGGVTKRDIRMANEVSRLAEG
jgi:4a-hydroxytetrahydrobiopterin dehydratase